MKETEGTKEVKVPSFFEMKQTIGITYDLKTDWRLKDGEPADTNAEFDTQMTLDFIIKGLETSGYQIKKIGNARKLLEQIPNLGVDIVFNICEGYRGRNRESEVPVLLEMNNIPFIGADALTLGISLDKAMAKKCFVAEGIPTPKYFVAHTQDDLKKADEIGYPLMVKTRHEGTSKGISADSRVEDINGLAVQVKRIKETYHQGALVEEFIKGCEFTVPVIGNGQPVAMPTIQVQIDGKTDLGDEFYTFERVVNLEAVDYLCPAAIPPELDKKMRELAIKAYKSVDCRDLGRVDFRVDEEGRPYCLEINPLPSLAHNDVFNIFPQAMGSSYEKILDIVVKCGLKRYGLYKDDPFQELDLLQKEMAA